MSLLNGFIQISGVEVVAGCDVYGIKRKRFEKRVLAFNTKAGITSKPVLYEKYQDLLKRKDITAVVIAVRITIMPLLPLQRAKQVRMFTLKNQ